MVKKLEVTSSTLVSRTRTKPMGNVNAAIRVTSAGFDARRPGDPPATTRSKRPPSAMKTPPRKAFSIRSTQGNFALAAPASAMSSWVSGALCESTLTSWAFMLAVVGPALDGISRKLSGQSKQRVGIIGSEGHLEIYSLPVVGYATMTQLLLKTY